MNHISIVCESPDLGAQITTSDKSYNELLKYYDRNTLALQEQFVVLFLNQRNRVMGGRIMFIGGTAGTVADPKVIFSVALAYPGCSAIILSHNHPSGNPSPSPEDMKITDKIKGAGLFLDIRVLDHIIVGKDTYYSMADEGRI